MEQFSIDEVFGDITGLRRMYRDSYAGIGRRIKKEIQKKLGITVSVGLSTTKILAKLCSRYKKPDGFTEAPGYRLHSFLTHIPLSSVCGFGPQTQALLSKCGIRTVYEYVRRPEAFARRLLGKVGGELWHELRGTSVYRVTEIPKRNYLSISKTKSFTPPSAARDRVKAELTKNLESSCIKLRRHHLAARTCSAYLKEEDFRTCGLEASLNRHSSCPLDFSGICAELFDALFDPKKKYRATGIILSGISAEESDRYTLFDDPVVIRKTVRLSGAVDRINRLYGKHTVHLASSFPAMSRSPGQGRNSLAWRKQALLKGESFRKRLSIPLLKITV